VSTEIVVTPLTATLAARVDGVDLRKTIPEVTARQIREAFWKHLVLVFPDPDGLVGLEEQTRLAALFGEPQETPAMTLLGDKGRFIVLDPRLSGGRPAPRLVAENPSRYQTVDHRPGDFGSWHTDVSFAPQLNRVGTLRAEVIPPVGGDTTWANLCAAYEALSPAWKEWLPGLKAVHAPPPGYKASIDVWQYGPDAEARFDAAFPPREHPIVIEHPDTARPALFVNPAFVVEIAGMTRQESAHLLRFLYSHITSSRFLFRHHWSPGDIVLWDELACLHLAPVDYAPHDRRNVRVTAGLATPTASRR
jgi:taurine dioxygenase